MKKKTWIGIIAAGVCICAVLAVAAGSFLGTKVEKAKAVVTAVNDYYTEEGVLRGGKEYQVISEVSGSVSEILVSENSAVKKGDVLLVIDSVDYEHEKAAYEYALAGYEAQLEQSRFNRLMTASPQEYLSSVKQELAACEAAYTAAKTLFEGSQVLYESGSISKIEFEKNQADYQAAQLAWTQAKGRFEESQNLLSSMKSEGISQAEINSRFFDSEEKQLTAQMEAQKQKLTQLDELIDKCRITAPTDGIVTSLPADGMNMVQAGQTVVTMNGTEKMMAEADVLTNIAPYIKKGDPVEVVLKLRGGETSYTGTVDEVYSYAAQGISSLGLDEYRVHVKVVMDEDQDLSGYDGYGVNVRFCLFSEESCLTIPSSAVFKSDGRYYVFQIEGGKAVKKEVELRYQTGTEAVVESGLAEGETVILQVDSEAVYEGAKVR